VAATAWSIATAPWWHLPTSFKNPQAALAALGTMSHEFFHCWNVERIRQKSLEPFNFEDANISGELWLAEGFTQYYGPLIMVRAGVAISDPAGLVRNAVAVINSPARRFRSAVEMSQMAPFSDAAVAIDETNLPTTFISYYTYGAAIATALDLSLRDRSNGKVTLDDFMRAMWIAHGKPGGPSPAIIAKPYTLKDVRDQLAKSRGSPICGRLLRQCIEARAPDYESCSRVSASFLNATPVARGGPDDQAFGEGRGGHGGAGPRPPARGSRRPRELGTPACPGGIEEGDVITSADGKAVATIQD
jgi:predicted metalloprotease with PDZ domain